MAAGKSSSAGQRHCPRAWDPSTVPVSTGSRWVPAWATPDLCDGALVACLPSLGGVPVRGRCSSEETTDTSLETERSFRSRFATRPSRSSPLSTTPRCLRAAERSTDTAFSRQPCVAARSNRISRARPSLLLSVLPPEKLLWQSNFFSHARNQPQFQPPDTGFRVLGATWRDVALPVATWRSRCTRCHPRDTSWRTRDTSWRTRDTSCHFLSFLPESVAAVTESDRLCLTGDNQRQFVTRDRRARWSFVKQNCKRCARTLRRSLLRA